MARSKETFSKKDVRTKQAKKRKEKEKRRQEKKEQGTSSFDDMIAYVDENGMLTDTPPDPNAKRKEIKAENIEVGVPKQEDRIIDNTRTGRLKNFDESKGFGFIIDSDTKDSIFVHINDCIDEISIGNRVQFEIEKGLKGLKAVKVKLI
jgi:cold shock CspA family protein